MTHSERLIREKDRKRRLILNAARELFAREGFENVSMRRIANQANYSPAALYRYFKNKKEILSVLRNEGFRGYVERQKSLRAIPDVFERLHECGRRYVQFALENPDDFELMYCTTCDEVDMEGELAEESMESYREFRSLVKEVVASGELGDWDEETVAFALWSGVQGLASLANSGRLDAFAGAAVNAEFYRKVLGFMLRKQPLNDG